MPYTGVVIGLACTSMRKIFGAGIILLGVSLLLQQLNVPGVSTLFNIWWPIIIIMIGFVMWGSNPQSWFGPLVVVLIGTVFLLDRLNLIKRSVWDFFWPGVFILAGVKLVLGAQRSKDTTSGTWSSGQSGTTALFSGIERKVTGELHDEEITAWFGGAKFDLREAKWPEHVTLNVSAGFGGVEILVPPHVRVESRLAAILGGVQEAAAPMSSVTSTLTITGSAFCGGVNIKR